MSSDICIGEQYLWVSNQRLRTLVEFVVEVGRDVKSTPAESEFVDRLENWITSEYWAGQSFDLEERFPSIEEKKFWAKCFFDLARKIFLREIGNNQVHFWQAGAIGESYMTGRLICHAVQKQTGQSWYPDTEDGKSAEAYYHRLNIQD